MTIAGAIAVAALVGMAFIVVHAVHGSSSSFASERWALDGKCKRVLVARSAAQRTRGLRDAKSLGQYAGMLFVFPSESDARFTMAQTLIPLNIGWYDAAGAQVDHTRMTPCPRGTDATCPSYASKNPYRYAFETAGGTGSPSAIGACAA
jgi:uncharacterized membrane protein (UPF0127 family)